MQVKQQGQKGFTLIELLIVIAIIGFLAAAVLVAVDPVKRIQDARDSRRFAEVNGMLNAILTKQVDDRAVYNGALSSPIITSVANSQVIVTNDAGVICTSGLTGLTANYPGCQQAIDTATAGTVLTGTINTNSGTAITGTATLFTTQVRIGDVIYVAATPAKNCTVAAIASDTALTCVTTPGTLFVSGNAISLASRTCVTNLGAALTGTASSSGTAVTGTGTSFTIEVAAGDVLTSASGGTCTVSTITNALAIVCSNTPSPVFSGAVTDTSKSIAPTYIASIPTDPRSTGAVCVSGCTTNASGITSLGSNNTGYYVHRTTGNRVEIGSCSPEDTTTNPTISVKR